MGRVAEFYEKIVTDSLPVWVGEKYLEYHRATFTTQGGSSFCTDNWSTLSSKRKRPRRWLRWDDKSLTRKKHCAGCGKSFC